MDVDRTALLDWLVAEGVRRDAYDFSGDFGSEAYVLRAAASGWEVFYSERGQKRALREFALEEAACEYFRSLIDTDASTRRQ